MKRVNYILLAVTLFMFSLTACSGAKNSAVLTEVFPLQGGGQGLKIGQEIDETTKLPAGLSVYKNEYPVTHGGPQYQLDEEKKEKLEQAMNELLTELYIEYGLSQPEDGFTLAEPEAGKERDWTYRRAFSNDWFSVYGWPGLLRVKLDLSVSDPLLLDAESGSTDLLLENFAVKAAMRYVGIGEPQADLQKSGGSSYQCQIIEASSSIEETVYRNAFEYVQIDLHKDDEKAVLFVDACRLKPEKLSEVSAFSYDEVMEFIQQTHPDFDLSSAKYRLYLDKAIEPGQYRPCYKITDAQDQSIYAAPMSSQDSAGSQMGD